MFAAQKSIWFVFTCLYCLAQPWKVVRYTACSMTYCPQAALTILRNTTKQIVSLGKMRNKKWNNQGLDNENQTCTNGSNIKCTW